MKDERGLWCTRIICDVKSCAHQCDEEGICGLSDVHLSCNGGFRCHDYLNCDLLEQAKGERPLGEGG